MEEGDRDRKRRQDDERLVLESIYGDDVTDAPARRHWKVWRPLDLIIHLSPVASASAVGEKMFVSVDLHVKCSHGYPELNVPEIFLENAKGIGEENLKNLRSCLVKKAAEMKGSEVIMELCQMVQQFLYDRNKPPAGSFHEQMELEKRLAVSRQRATSEQREREELVAYQETMEEKLMWKKAEDLEKAAPPTSTFCSTEDLMCVDGVERRVCRVASFGLRRKAPHSLCTEWNAFDPLTNNDLFVSEWNFEYVGAKKGKGKKAFDVETFEAELNNLEKEMVKVTKLVHVDPSLYAYTFLAVQRKSISSANVSVRIVYGQSVDLSDRTLSSSMATVTSQPEVMVPRLAAHALYALRWLHESRFAHSAISDSTVWMTVKRSFRFSDYILRPLVDDLCDVFEQCTGTGGAQGTRVGRGSRRDDFALVAALLEPFSTLTTASAMFTANVKGFLEACNGAKSIYDLSEHPFVIQDDVTSSQLGSLEPNEKASNVEKSSHSRLTNEFVYLEFLGRGGFGDVILSKNKLDGNVYAVKRIPLDPKDERLNRKIMREAKLFSKLNHPNVVRYYSAWIENASSTRTSAKLGGPLADVIGSPANGNTEESTSSDGADSSLMASGMREAELRAQKLNVAESTAEWSISFQKVAQSPSDSDDTDEKNQPSQSVAMPVRTLFSPAGALSAETSEFEVLFEGEGGDESADEGSPSSDSADGAQKEAKGSTASGLASGAPAPLRILFIQMEYCEKSTLRNLINSTRLFSNARSVWRIFREILLGLQYIHQQGMIHRDIKPMNILMDGNGRVKIGDFGLATLDFLERSSAHHAASADLHDSSQTRDIGTALYVAPELLSTSAASSDYTTKIDVFSLGIVLFEMFYRPLLPGMERLSIVKSLRNSSIFPSDFAAGVAAAHRKTAKELITMMLNRIPDDRPSVQMLLDSERVPLVEMEASEFQKMFCQALRTRGGRMYQWMLDTIIAQPLPPAADFLFDQAACSVDHQSSVARQRAAEGVIAQLTRLCSLRAFVPFAAHSVAPFSDSTAFANLQLRPWRFIDENGLILALPFDLRKSFIRYCVRNGMNRVKRYAYGKVYSRSDALGVHPMERTEFSVDSVGPQSSAHLLSAEVLGVVLEAAAKLDAVRTHKWQLCVGHGALIQATALHLGFVEKRSMEKILNALYAVSTSSKHLSREQKLERLRVGGEMSFSQAQYLFTMLQGEQPTLGDLRERTRPLLNARSDRVSTFVRSAIDDLANCLGILELLSGKKERNVRVDCSLCYRPQTFSCGLVFQLQLLVPHGRSTRPVIVCCGGRYDDALKAERHVQDPIAPIPLSAVGCAFAVDVLAQLISTRPSGSCSAWCSALVCSASSELLTEKARLVRLLRQRGIAADLLHDPVRAVQEDHLIEHCAEKRIDHLLMVMGADEVLLRSRSVNDDGKLSVDHGKISFAKAVQKIEGNSASTPTEAILSSDSAVSQSPVRGNEGVTTTVPASTATTFGNVNVHYAVGEKLAYVVKKRIEAQVRLSLQKALLKFTASTLVEVVVVDLSAECTAKLASFIDRGATATELDVAFTNALQEMNKQKKELKWVREAIDDIYGHSSASVLVLFSRAAPNGYYKFIL